MRCVVIALAVTMGHAACNKDTPRDPKGSPDRSSLTADLSCTQDSDCVFVRAGCCGCNAGGGNEIVNQAAAARRKPPTEAECKDVSCAQVMVDGPECTGQPACRAGMCVAIAKEGSAPPPGPAKP